MVNTIFTLYRFVGDKGKRTTQIVRDPFIADGMRTLLPGDKDTLTQVNQKVHQWASDHGFTILPHDPYPSTKHPGMVWLEYRFCGLVL
jgi:hypothetical protein